MERRENEGEEEEEEKGELAKNKENFKIFALINS